MALRKLRWGDRCCLTIIMSLGFATATTPPTYAQPQTLSFSQSQTRAASNSSGKSQVKQAFAGKLATFLGHEGGTQDAVFSPDGQQILTASQDKTARLWDRQGNLLVVFRGHTNWVHSAEFSSDGQQILTTSADKTARLWDRQGHLIAVFGGSGRNVSTAKLSPDGRQILTTGDNNNISTQNKDNTAQLWDSRGNLLTVFRGHEDSVRSAIFSPDGNQILTASNDKTARLWDRQGNSVAIFRGHKDTVLTSVFSPDGQQVLTASFDDTRLWDRQGNPLTVFQQGWGAVFSPDGQQVLTVGYLDARLWDRKGNPLAVLKKKGIDISLSRNVNEFSPDSRYVLIDDGSGGTGLWDVKGNLLATFPTASGFSSDSQRILTTSYNGNASLWDISDTIATQAEITIARQAFREDVSKNTAQLAVFQDRDSEFYSAIFSPDGKQILTTSPRETVKLWDRQGKILTRLKPEAVGESFKRAIFSPDGQQILTARDNIAKLWDQQGNLLSVLQGHGHDDTITRVEFSSNGQYILTNGSRGTVRLWNRQGNLLIKLEMGNKDATFSLDSKYIFGISGPKTVHVWDLQGNLLTTIQGDENAINSAVLSPDGQRILTTAGWRGDNTARLWDRSGNLLTVFRGHEAQVFTAKFSPDGQQVLTSSADKTDRLWDRQGNLIAILRHGYEYRVAGPPIFSPDGQKILTRGDQSIWLWDRRGTLLAVLRGHESTIDGAEFSPDGRQILTTSSDRTVRLWDVSAAIGIQAEEMAAKQTSQAKISETNAPQARAAFQSATQFNQQGTVESRQQALQKLEEVLRLYRTDNNIAKVANTLHFMGNIHANFGEFQTALDAYNQALTLSRQAGAKAEEASIFNSLGQLYTDLADPKTALDYYNQALPLLYQLNDKGGAANTFNNIGNIQADSNEWKAALNTYTKALIISRPVGDLAAEATALTGIGNTYIASKEWQTALNAYNQSLIITRHLKDKIKETTTLNQLGKIHVALGENSIALEQYNQALALSRQLGYKTEEANILYNKANLDRQQNNLTAAKTNIETAIQITEALRSQLASQELRQSYFARNQSYYQLYIDLLMQLHQQNPKQGYDTIALNTSERARARSLLEQLTESSLNLKADLDPAILAEEKRLTQALNAADQKRLNLLNNPKGYNNPDLEATKTEINTILQQLQTLATQIRRANPAYANLKYPDPLTLEGIQSKLLDDKTLLLQYALGKERSYLFLVSKTGLKTYTLPPKAEIEAAVEAYRKNLQSPNFTDLSQGQQLSQMLLGQIEPELKEQRLVIVGDGKLQLLPFAALPWGSSITPLLAKHEIITLPSVTSLAVQREQWQKRPQASKILAVLADPVFKNNDSRFGEKATPIVPGDLSQQIPTIAQNSQRSCGDFDRLLHTATEAEQILALIPDAQKFSALGFDANYSTATNPALSQYRILHLATHGCIQDNPLLSNLALSFFNADGQKAETSLLKLQDIYNLKLNADLVVLSACQTGTGKEVQGEGIVGLTRGFMYAGARRVVVSLWSVNDRATSVLMTDYYRQMLQQGLNPAAALRQAQLTTWRSNTYAAPYYWAAFTIQGDW